ncbi:MAG TPA: c-type cytochrome [Acidobacteriota bacterium]|nr:c-type cytochrome [Acidobacteriota bacterium]
MSRFFFLIAGLVACLFVIFPGVPAQLRAQDSETAKAEMLKRGAQIYKSRCQLCHMPGGKAATKNMRLDDDEWKHGKKPEQIEKVVAEGVKGTAMMGFKKRLKPDDIKAVSAYVLSLSSPDPD